MYYKKVIETNQTWVCPRSGYYRITAVAGGESGSSYLTTETVNLPVSGGATSFGDIISANGSVGNFKKVSAYNAGGEGGYTLINCGGSGALITNDSFMSPSINGGLPGCSGNGYGAGGGVSTRNYSGNNYPGRAGKILVSSAEVTEGKNIICTIGKGGVTLTPEYATNGNDGVIVIEFIEDAEQ